MFSWRSRLDPSGVLESLRCTPRRYERLTCVSKSDTGWHWLGPVPNQNNSTAKNSPVDLWDKDQYIAEKEGHRILTPSLPWRWYYIPTHTKGLRHNHVRSSHYGLNANNYMSVMHVRNHHRVHLQVSRLPHGSCLRLDEWYQLNRQRQSQWCFRHRPAVIVKR